MLPVITWCDAHPGSVLLLQSRGTQRAGSAGSAGRRRTGCARRRGCWTGRGWQRRRRVKGHAEGGGSAHRLRQAQSVLDRGGPSAAEEGQGACREGGAAHRLRQTQRVLDREGLTTAEEKLSKVSGPA